MVLIAIRKRIVRACGGRKWITMNNRTAGGVYIFPGAVWRYAATYIIIKPLTHIKTIKVAEIIFKFYALRDSVFSYFVRNF